MLGSKGFSLIYLFIFMMVECSTCRAWLKVSRLHADSHCPLRTSAWCSRCSCYGHLPSECDTTQICMVDRPQTLEELVPEEVRLRWNIKTVTPIAWSPPLDTSLVTRETEIAASNSLYIIYSSKGGWKNGMDSQIRKFMKANGLANSSGHTKHAMNDNIKKLREWAVSQGKKIVFQETD